MICIEPSEVVEALNHAVSVVGGSLVAVSDGWQWQPNGGNDRVVQFRLGRTVHRLILDPLEPPAIEPGKLEEFSATVHRWLQWNSILPAGIGITMQSDARPLFRAAIPNRGYDANELSQAVQALLRGFASLPADLSALPESDSREPGEGSPVSAEAITAWADDASVTLEVVDRDDDESPHSFALKLPALEPARLLVDRGVRIAIDAAIDNSEEPSSAAARAAEAVLALSIGNRLPLIRAAITTSDATAIEYQASAASIEGTLPPSAWLQRATAELTAATGASRRELEALHTSSSLANFYLSARGLALKSAAPS